ncbi:MAG: substrate-binding domain-containing protein [Alphaproteobacteria bacterium]|nr:substrate-binding domain-containing protein [Alphaproteobacteria bacterium]
MNNKLLSLAVLAGVAVGGFAEARDQINIVGSSTVYPFTTAVAETFGKTTKFRTPVVESTGSGGGLKLFCAGVGVGHPDMTNASRRIKESEVETCAKNGVTDIIEVKVGYDGIVLANAKSAPQMTISRKHLFLALAKDIPQDEGKLVPNPFKMWNEIDPSLPATKIEVLGPPPTSGTRDAFVELAMEGGCKKFGWIKAMKKKDKKKYKAICHGIREDGAFVEAGENDNLIVQKLVENSKAYGVFGFSFLDQNANLIQGSVMDGVAPTFENIAAADYPVSRPLYVYVKKAHIGKISGMEEFLAEYTSEKAWGPDGYLTDKGLIPMPDAERGKFREAATKMIPYGS